MKTQLVNEKINSLAYYRIPITVNKKQILSLDAYITLVKSETRPSSLRQETYKSRESQKKKKKN